MPENTSGAEYQELGMGKDALPFEVLTVIAGAEKAKSVLSRACVGECQDMAIAAYSQGNSGVGRGGSFR